MPRRRRERVPEIPPFPGDTVTVRIESLVAGGAGLARLPDGRILFALYAAPGELVEVEIERVQKDYLEGATRKVIEPSPDRIEPRCPLFGECGGCQLQHITYDAQLAAKTTVVREQFLRIAHMADPPVEAMVGARDPWAYRNHLRFSTGKMHGDVGFIHRRGRGLLKVEDCPIADPWINALLPKLQGHGAGLHQVQVRRNNETGSYLLLPEMPALDIPTGQRSYRERLAGHDFQVSDSAFFQVNSAQAEEMVRLIGEALPSQGELFVDAFAGVATFAVLFANRFRHVLAIEESGSANKDAVVNIAQTPNVEIRAGKVEQILPELMEPPDAIVLDPPRAGCQPVVLDALVRFAPRVIVYVSCNPATLARDARVLVNGGYTLDRVTPLDMFPQTGHIECVTKFSRDPNWTRPEVEHPQDESSTSDADDAGHSEAQ